MADKNHRPVLQSDNPAGGVHIIRQGRERVLDSDGVKAARFKDGDDLAPTATVREGAVNKNDVGHGLLLRLCTNSAQENGRYSDRSRKNRRNCCHRVLLKLRLFRSARSTELCNARAACDLHNFADVDRPNESLRRTAGTRAHMMAGGYTRDVVALPSLRSLPLSTCAPNSTRITGPPITEFGSVAIRTVRTTSSQNRI